MRSTHHLGGVRSLRRVPPPGFREERVPATHLARSAPFGAPSDFFRPVPQARRARPSSLRAARRWRSTSCRPVRSAASSASDPVVPSARTSIRRVRSSSWLASEDNSASNAASVRSGPVMAGVLPDAPTKPHPSRYLGAGSVGPCFAVWTCEGTAGSPPVTSRPSCPDPRRGPGDRPTGPCRPSGRSWPTYAIVVTRRSGS